MSPSQRVRTHRAITFAKSAFLYAFLLSTGPNLNQQPTFNKFNFYAKRDCSLNFVPSEVFLGFSCQFIFLQGCAIPHYLGHHLFEKST